MTIEAVGGSAGWTDVVATGTALLRKDETTARAPLGGHGGRLIFEIDPSATASNAVASAGLIKLTLPPLTYTQVLTGAIGSLSMGAETFGLRYVARGLEPSGGLQMEISYTLTR